METLFLINFEIYGALLIGGIVLNYLFFGSLKKHYPAYYKSIGEPIVLVTIGFADTEEEIIQKYIRSLKSASFVYRMAFRGIPEHFPKNARLRRLAQAIRIVFTIVIILFIALLVSGYLFYKSTT